jgi:tetratricopeptide (TPR) repeat protein
VQGKVYSFCRFAARGRLAARDGDFDEALRLVRLAIEVAERSSYFNYRARVWLALAEVSRAAGDGANADAALAQALELYEAKGNVAAVARLTTSTTAP